MEDQQDIAKLKKKRSSSICNHLDQRDLFVSRRLFQFLESSSNSCFQYCTQSRSNCHLHYPDVKQPLTLTACGFNVLLETDFGEDLFVWYRNLEKEQNNQEHPMTDGSSEMFWKLPLLTEMLTHRASEEEKENVEL